MDYTYVSTSVFKKKKFVTIYGKPFQGIISLSELLFYFMLHAFDNLHSDVASYYLLVCLTSTIMAGGRAFFEWRRGGDKTRNLNSSYPFLDKVCLTPR